MSSPPPAPLGWVPQNEGGDEVGPSQHFIDNSETGPVFSDSLSSFSTFHVDEPDSDEDDRQLQAADHIPRPPNSFMLYRKQVCKDFARVGPRSRRSNRTGPAPVPGHISKRAGMMWKALPPEERKVWDDLAAWHKEEHARKYPGYVYKPVRRSASERRSKRRSRSAAHRHPLGRNPAASSSQATLTSRAGTPRSSNTTPVPDSPISASSSVRSPDLAQTPSRRALHRRSLSVPIYPNFPPVVDEEPQFSERTLRRRSRSITVMTGERSFFSDYPFSTSSDFINFEDAFINYPAETPSAEVPYNEYTDGDQTSRCATPGEVAPYHASPLATVASNLSGTSSLAGWNGESMLAPRPQATSSWPSLLGDGYTPQTPETFYDHHAYPGEQLDDGMLHPNPNIPWNSHRPLYGGSESPDGYGPEFYSSMEAMDANALHQYDIGLNEQVVSRAAPSYLPFGLYPQNHETNA